MADPETTLPPRKPNTFRVWIPRIVAWCKSHPIITASCAGILVGLILPTLARWAF